MRTLLYHGTLAIRVPGSCARHANLLPRGWAALSPDSDTPDGWPLSFISNFPADITRRDVVGRGDVVQRSLTAPVPRPKGVPSPRRSLGRGLAWLTRETRTILPLQRLPSGKRRRRPE
jgi:hypothetical protein